jgi:hypothetical protein
MKNISDRNEDVQKALDLYEVKTGLPIAFPPGSEDELQAYLNLSRTDIEALTPSQCSAIAARLSAFAFHIQRMYNRETATAQWSDDAANDIVAKQWLSYKDVYGKHEVKAFMIAKDNAPLQELLKLHSQSKQRSLRLKSLADSLQSLSRSFENNQRAKAFENR